MHRHTIRFTCLVSWLYDSGITHPCGFHLGLTYTHKHSPGLPSSFSDLMSPTVPAPAGSTVSAGATSHSKKIQLNLPHTYTHTLSQVHGSLLPLPHALLPDRLLGRCSRVSTNKFEPPSSLSRIPVLGVSFGCFLKFPTPSTPFLPVLILCCTNTHTLLLA